VALRAGELTGLAAVVTGGGSGIGLATARLLAERGARVAVLDLTPGEEFLGLRADVTDDESVRSAIATAAGRLGGIDILVNNAGIGAVGTVADNPGQQWRDVFEVNVLGIVRPLLSH
jgi:2-keto-3-deoxy-L-fuconate dehydrogenase